MRLYSGTSLQFIHDTVQNQIAEKLRNAFFDNFGYRPSENEVRSWRNSLRAVKDVFELAKLDDHGVILEYQLPLTSQRLDCLVCGKNGDKHDRAVIIELKQWDKCGEADGEHEVSTWLGHGNREILHPSAQVGQYQMWLEDTHTAFHEGANPVRLNACAYLHNYNYYTDDVLFATKFKDILARYPLFTADDVDKLAAYLSARLTRGMGIDVLKRIEESRYRASKKLMDHVAKVIHEKSEYILLDEQLVVYDKVLACAKRGFHDKQKTALIIKGGPGTGKSVIAINLMADLLKAKYNAHYVTGSRAFTKTLRKIIGTRGAIQFKYFNSYTTAEKNAVDVVICDEAHRIRETSNTRFTKKTALSGQPQVQELLDAAKVCVFFIDDDQVVRPNEIGSSAYIGKHAHSSKCKIFEYELEAQFRCQGSDAFVNWINNTLGIRRTANALWKGDEGFDFKIFNSPFDLEKAIQQKVSQGSTGRMTAGFCWRWSDPYSDGTLQEDVIIGQFRRPWNAKPEAKKLAPGIPPAMLWAYDPGGIDQIGCIYTAQGFEFDYAGVIIGKDLTYSLDRQQWEGHRENSFDPVVRRSTTGFSQLVKNAYRVLLSRGLKGCYVHFVDKNTERFVKSRIEQPEAFVQKPSHKRPGLAPGGIEITADIEDEDKYRKYLPVYSMKAAAGYFGSGTEVRPEGWVRISSARRLNRLMFVCQVSGHSMEPLIPDGSYCIFKANVTGTRQGKVLLVQHRSISDPETGGSYTVKEYRSAKKYDRQGGWEHEKIQLLSRNMKFEPIVIPADEAADFMIIAELIEVLK